MGSATVEEVLACLADVLELRPSDLDPDAPLTALGLESFTAVRLRRRLLEEVGLDLQLTAFLGTATARTVAAGIVPDEPVGQPFPLTPVQAAYLVGRDPAFPLGGVATFYYYEYDRPSQDLDRLESAWNRLVRRHPMLRMVVDAHARQRVLDQVPDYVIARTDLRGESPERVEEALDALRIECSHQVLPADQWPLFDLRAALLPDGRARLFIGVDVLALDLMSWMRLMREWGTLVADPDVELPAPPLGFADLVRRRLDDPAERRRRELDAAYWAGRAPGLPDGPALPWSRGPADLRGQRFTRHAAELSAEEWGQLRKQGAAHGLSPTGLLLAAFGLVLQRWGAREPFCLNTTLFDRGGADIPDLDSVVGDFTSTVLVEILPADPGRWYGFAGYAAAVNRQFWTDLDHRAVSGMETLRAAIEAGKRSRVTDPDTGLPLPTHTVVFTSGVGLAGPGDAPAAWLGTEVFGVSQTPQVLLDHIIWDEEGRLRIAWDAVDEALPDGFVDGMLAAHVCLLRRLATEPELWTDPALGWDPSFLRDGEPPSGAFDGAGPLLDDPLRAAAERDPSAPALLEPAGEVSAGELAERAARTGRALAALGVGPGDLVAVAADKGSAQVTALLGVSASGAGYVPVEPAWPASRVASVCEQASIRHALLTAEADATLWPENVTVHRLDADGVLAVVGERSAEARRAADEGLPPEVRRPKPDDLAYAIFTSGSTGRPKGVAIEHRAARTTLDDLAERFPLGPGDRVLALSAFSFDLSVFDIFSVLGSGGAMVLPEARRQRDPGHWLELMARHQVTVWNTAPALLEMLVEYAELEPETVRRALSTLRLVFLSGDWIPVTLPDRLRALAPHAEVVSLGGATEAAIWSICHPIGRVDPSWPSIPYGRALRGQSFHILDEHGEPCPVGEPGELHIGGAGLARGYVGDPGQTAERFITHPILRRRLYRTGDLGRWRYDGTIEFLGRLDRQVKIRGHRIELGEIEATLDRLPAVRQAVARAVRGPDERPRLVCYVVPAESSAPPSDDELSEALRASLPAFMVPNRFLLMDELPITANGKVDHQALANPYQRSDDPLRPPATASDARTPASARDSGVEGASGGLGVRTFASPGGNGVEGESGGLGTGRASVDAAGARAFTSTVTRGLRLSVTVSPDGVMELVIEGGADGGEITRPVLAQPVGSVATSVLAQPVGSADEPETTSASETRDQVWEQSREQGRRAGADPQVERVVARVFSDLLKMPVDVTTPFFQLGASSLTIVLAQRALSAKLDGGLTVVDLFARPTVRELAAFITARRRTSDQAPATPPPPDGPRPEPVTGRAAARRAARVHAEELAG